MASKHNTRSSKPPPRQGDKSPVTPTSDIGRAAAFSGGRNAGSRSTPSSPTSTRAGFRLPFSDLGEGGFPATEVIRYLLKTVDRDVVTFRRNTQVPYMILDRVRELVNGIDGLIKKVEEGTGDWNSFDAYSRAIAPLEDLLLQLLAFTEVEKTQHLADPGSVDNAIVSSEKWEAHRGVFMRYLGELHTRPELARFVAILILSHQGIVVSKDTSTAHQESLEAQAGDDRALFEDVLSAAKGRFSDVVPTHASNIETSLGALRKSIIAVKASLLVEGVLQVLEAATLGGSVLRHLRSATVWDSFLELFRSLSTVTISEDGIAQVTDKYDSLLRIIKTLPGHELPASYVDIIKRAAYVRPPFREQAFALVTLCHDLATQFNNAADSTDDNVRTLNEAFSVTLRSLEAASRAVSQLTIFDLTRFEDNGIVESFEQAKTSIRDGFISYGVYYTISLCTLRVSDSVLPLVGQNLGGQGVGSHLCQAEG
ncbi:hypothetical protein BC834DRAFT_844447 [Gloeopeniophorella convolvens]|nr:hypothetical protein BC834DRAFT_844447 [Gloeopeniophorella convolvens]